MQVVEAPLWEAGAFEHLVERSADESYAKTTTLAPEVFGFASMISSRQRRKIFVAVVLWALVRMPGPFILNALAKNLELAPDELHFLAGQLPPDMVAGSTS